MQTRIRPTEKNRRRSNDIGKCACISFAAHELHLMDELEKLADSEYMTKSSYIKRFIRSESRKLKDQQMTDWAGMYGGRT